MTTQEFITKEKNRIVNEVFHPATDYSESKLLAKQEFGNGIITGLTKGLEIAKEAILFIANCTEETANEIVQKVITEKYGK